METFRGQFYSAGEQFMASFGGFFLNFLNLEAFYRTTKESVRPRETHIADQYRQAWREAAALPEFQHVLEGERLTDTAALFKAFPEAMAKRSIRLAEQTIDSAAVVFAHTLLDGVLSDCCRIAFLADPNDWYRFVEDRKVETKRLRTENGESIIQQLCWEFVCQQQRESMIQRLRLLQQICAPRLKGQSLPTRWITKDALENFDKLRQRIIHRQPFSTRISVIEDRLHFAKRAGLSVMMLIFAAYPSLLHKSAELKSPRAILRLCAILRREFPEFQDIILQQVENEQK